METKMNFAPFCNWFSRRRKALANYGQRPATLWDIRLSMIASQIVLAAFAALILWAIL